MWKPGDTLGPYTLTAQLSAGGMGALYTAQRRGPGGFARTVAIKAIHPHLATDPAFVRMFLDEARLAARVVHPNVVHVEELSRHVDGAYYLVMEYVPGVPLVRLLAALAHERRTLAPGLAVWIAAQAADGLHAAHETRGDDDELLGVVHRDVSPQNVLLSAQGHVKLIDFGIAKARGQAQTGAGLLRGKVRYMAPEQAYGRAVDRRTDVYAVGIVLWEMLTCRRMFDGGDDFALLDSVRQPSPVPPSRYTPGIPPALDDVVLAALAPSPDDRPATALELRCRLAEVMPDALVMGPTQLAALLVAVLGPRFAQLPAVNASSRAVASEAPLFESTAPADALTQFTVGVAELPAYDDATAPSPSGELPSVAVEHEATANARPSASRWRRPIALVVALVGVLAVATLAIEMRGPRVAVVARPTAPRAPAPALPVLAVAPLAPTNPPPAVPTVDPHPSAPRAAPARAARTEQRRRHAVAHTPVPHGVGFAAPGPFPTHLGGP